MRNRKTLAGVVATLLITAVLAVGGTSSPVGAIADQTLSGTASSMWQTNNTVYALATANGVLYAGGSFTAVRPPGAAQGTSEAARTYLAAFNTATGARYQRDPLVSTIGPVWGGLDTIIADSFNLSSDRNSPTTNTMERKVMKDVYNMVIQPTLVDAWLRQWSGHTQVNAADLRRLRYPSLEQLVSLGERVRDRFPAQPAIDHMVGHMVEAVLCQPPSPL